PDAFGYESIRRVYNMTYNKKWLLESYEAETVDQFGKLTREHWQAEGYTEDSVFYATDETKANQFLTDWTVTITDPYNSTLTVTYSDGQYTGKHLTSYHKKITDSCGHTTNIEWFCNAKDYDSNKNLTKYYEEITDPFDNFTVKDWKGTYDGKRLTGSEEESWTTSVDGSESHTMSETFYTYDSKKKLTGARGTTRTEGEDGFGNTFIDEAELRHEIVNGHLELTGITGTTRNKNVDGSFSISRYTIKYLYGDKNFLVDALGETTTAGEDIFGSRFNSQTTDNYIIIGGQAKRKTSLTDTGTVNFDSSEILTQTTVEYEYDLSGYLIDARSFSKTKGSDVFGNRYETHSHSIYAIINGEARVISSTSIIDSYDAGWSAESSSESGDIQSIIDEIEQFLNIFIGSTSQERKGILASLGIGDFPLIELTTLGISAIIEWLGDTGTKILNCAINALHSILATLGIEVTTGEIASKTILIDILTGTITPQSASGELTTSMFALVKQAALKGVNLSGAHLSLEQLQSLSTSAIAHIDGNHFVVVSRIEDGKVFLSGANGESMISIEDFSSRWNGDVLMTTTPQEGTALSKQRMKEIRGAAGSDTDDDPEFDDKPWLKYFRKVEEGNITYIYYYNVEGDERTDGYEGTGIIQYVKVGRNSDGDIVSVHRESYNRKGVLMELLDVEKDGNGNITEASRKYHSMGSRITLKLTPNGDGSQNLRAIFTSSDGMVTKILAIPKRVSGHSVVSSDDPRASDSDTDVRYMLEIVNLEDGGIDSGGIPYWDHWEVTVLWRDKEVSGYQTNGNGKWVKVVRRDINGNEIEVDWDSLTDSEKESIWQQVYSANENEEHIVYVNYGGKLRVVTWKWEDGQAIVTHISNWDGSEVTETSLRPDDDGNYSNISGSITGAIGNNDSRKDDNIVSSQIFKRDGEGNIVPLWIEEKVTVKWKEVGGERQISEIRRSNGKIISWSSLTAEERFEITRLVNRDSPDGEGRGELETNITRRDSQSNPIYEQKFFGKGVTYTQDSEGRRIYVLKDLGGNVITTITQDLSDFAPAWDNEYDYVNVSWTGDPWGSGVEITVTDSQGNVVDTSGFSQDDWDTIYDAIYRIEANHNFEANVKLGDGNTVTATWDGDEIRVNGSSLWSSSYSEEDKKKIEDAILAKDVVCKVNLRTSNEPDYVYVTRDSNGRIQVWNMNGETRAIPEVKVSISRKRAFLMWDTLTAVITVKKGTPSGQPIVGATVQGRWSGNYNATVSGRTDGNGIVRFATDRIGRTQTATFTVNKITIGGIQYDLAGGTSGKGEKIEDSVFRTDKKEIGSGHLNVVVRSTPVRDDNDINGNGDREEQLSLARRIHTRTALPDVDGIDLEDDMDLSFLNKGERFGLNNGFSGGMLGASPPGISGAAEAIFTPGIDLNPPVTQEVIDGVINKFTGIVENLSSQARGFFDKVTGGLEKAISWLRSKGEFIISCAVYALDRILEKRGQATFSQTQTEVSYSLEELAAETIFTDLITQQEKGTGTFSEKKVTGTFSEEPERVYTSAYALETAAKKRGLDLATVKTDLENLSRIDSPVIAHVGGNHFVVVSKVEDGKVSGIEATGEEFTIPEEEFVSKWDGIIIAPRSPPQGKIVSTPPKIAPDTPPTEGSYIDENGNRVIEVTVYDERNNPIKVTKTINAPDGSTSHTQTWTNYEYDYRGVLTSASGKSVAIGEDIFGNTYTSNTRNFYTIINGEAKVDRSVSTTKSSNVDGSTSVTEGEVIYEYDPTSGLLSQASGNKITEGNDIFGNRYSTTTDDTYAVIKGEAKLVYNESDTESWNIDGSYSKTTNWMRYEYTTGDEQPSQLPANYTREGKVIEGLCKGASSESHTEGEDIFGNSFTEDVVTGYESLINGQPKATTQVSKTTSKGIDGSTSQTISSLNYIYNKNTGNLKEVEIDGGEVEASIILADGSEWSHRVRGKVVTVGADIFGNRYYTETVNKYSQEMIRLTGQPKVEESISLNVTMNIDGSTSTTNSRVFYEYTSGKEKEEGLPDKIVNKENYINPVTSLAYVGLLKGVMDGSVKAKFDINGNGDIDDSGEKNPLGAYTLASDIFGNKSETLTQTDYIIINGQAKETLTKTVSHGTNVDGSLTYTIRELSYSYSEKGQLEVIENVAVGEGSVKLNGIAVNYIGEDNETISVGVDNFGNYYVSKT
ncbi:MAG: cysteine peptidase family C39 domain-containing protein, partial [Elusimicrobiota bacterium]|nr:cysteine peptidase family C39 domain-containing protein [Elusimicrobiota bacterium]